LIPVPYVDLFAIGGFQLKMIAELCKIHGVLFNNEVGKSLLAALMGSVGSVRLASSISGLLAGTVPVVGIVGSVVAWPAVGYGATWAIGRVFAMHFETGGTLFDFDALRMREHYQRELARPK
jgi:uncharacterized protein (DUF697 family)